MSLVVSKSHEWRTAKGNLIGEGIENQALLESHDAILIRCLTSGRIVFWNRGSQKLYGWSMKEAMGKPAYNLLQTELPEPLQDIKAKLRRHGCWTGELVQKKKRREKNDGCELLVVTPQPQRGPMKIVDVSFV